MTSHRELERTYAVPAEAVLPDLTRLDGVDAVDTGPQQELEATYFDTRRLDLFAHLVTLRRSIGGADEGWCLELPDGTDARHEVRLPLARARHQPPKVLRDLVLGLTRRESLSPVATIRALRSETTLRGGERVVAHVADDRVDAWRTLPDDEPRLLSWREWEVELVDGRRRLLREADSLLAGAGAAVADVPDKLGRVIGDATPGPAGGKRPHPKKPAARVLHAYLLAQVERLLLADRAVRRREDDGIHDLRVALRRLRTSLATFRPLVDPEVTDPLREEMRWVSHTIGSARDAEVVHHRLPKLVAEEPPGVVLGSARSVLAEAARADARDARRVTDETLRGERYLEMLERLDRLLDDPPWTDRAGQAAAKMLPKLIAKDFARVRARVRAVEDAGDPDERARLLHEVRKSAKRLRYACEAAGPVLGSDVAALEAGANRIQSLLGDYRDTVMTRARLLQIAAGATAGGTFTLGRLHAREEAEAVRLERAFADAWAELERQLD